MFKDFQVMSYNIIKFSGLEIAGGRLEEIFRRYVGSLKDDVVMSFQQAVAQMWDEWESQSRASGISDFFHQRGSELFTLWMCKLYPFEDKKLTLDFPKGQSSVDALVVLSYIFEKRELDYIRFILEKLDINGKSEYDAARVLFVNAIKSISDYFSSLIGTQFKIYTEDINEYEIEVNNSLYIEFQGAGRIK